MSMRCDNLVPQCSHGFAVFGALELIDHLYLHYKSPYMTYVKETLDPLPKMYINTCKILYPAKWHIYTSSCHIRMDTHIRKTALQIKDAKGPNSLKITATSCILLNKSCTARGITPGSEADPRIVCVLPLLVCPYAKTVP